MTCLACKRLGTMCVQIMKSDEDVRMISAEAPVLFAKARAISLLCICFYAVTL